MAHKISPILKIYHINQDDDDQVERFLQSQFSKYGKIININISLVSTPNANDLEPSDEFSASIRFVNSHSVIEVGYVLCVICTLMYLVSEFLYVLEMFL